MTQPAPLHPNQCRCPACLAARKAQYHADMDGASQRPAVRTTPPEEFDPLLDLSVRLMAPAQAIKQRNDELRKEIEIRDYILLALLHGSNDLKGDIDSATWPDRIYGDTLKRLKALADEDMERRATRDEE